MPAFGYRLDRTKAPSAVVLVLHGMRKPRAESGRRRLALRGVPPLNHLRAVEAQAVRQGLRQIEVTARSVRAAVDHLGQDFASVEADEQPDPAGKDRVCDALRGLQERLPARGAGMRRRGLVRGRARGVIAVLRAGNRDRSGDRAVAVGIPPRERHRADRRDQGHAGEPDDSLQPPRPHVRPGSTTASSSLIPSSRRRAAVVGAGAPVSGSDPLAVFGNAITSRMLDSPARSAMKRSIPRAKPPCGGAPICNASRNQPNFARASSSVMPIARNTRSWISWRWILIEPEP